MTGSYTPIYCAALLTCMGAAAYGQSPGSTAPQKEQSAAPAQSTNKESQTGMPVLPRGKKLVLKDGTFQNELLSPRQYGHSRLRLLVRTLRRSGGLLLLGSGTARGLAVSSRAHARQKSGAIDWSVGSRHSALPYRVRCL